MNSQEIIKEKQGTIVDVRTPEEYSAGNVMDSINIPLNEISEHIDRLKDMKAPLVICCGSGIRSAKAHKFLLQQGIDCCDGGSWLNLK